MHFMLFVSFFLILCDFFFFTQCLHAALGCLLLPPCLALFGPVGSFQHSDKSRLLSPSSSALGFPKIAYLPACLPFSCSLLNVASRSLYILSAFTMDLLLVSLTISYSFLKNWLIYFNWRLITLQYCSGFCHTLTWISHGCLHVPQPETPSHLPPYPIPQGHPRTLALSTPSHASNLDWWSISHVVIYMFQCCSFKSSHPHLLSQSPKSVLYICVSFALLHIGSLLPSF